MKMAWRGFLAVLAAMPFLSVSAVAQNYPNRPVTLVVPFPAGGSTDVVARIAAQELSKRIGVPVVTENRAGGGTIVGSLSVKTAKPDGYTLLLSTATFYSSALMQKNPGYEPFRDFVTLMPLASAAYVLMAPSGIKGLNTLVERSKTTPGQTNYGHLGAGAPQMVLAEQVKEATKIDWQAIPYKGAADVMVAMLRNDVQGFFGTDSLASQYIGNKDINLIAFTGTKRSRYVPDVPTFAELGYPDIQDFGYYVLTAHADTPAPIVETLRTHLSEVRKAPELLAALKANALEPFEGTLADYETSARARQARSAATLKRLGFEPN